MKKKTKIILFSILGTVGLLLASFGVAIIADCSGGGIGGTIVKDIQPGTGDDEWRQYDVDIALGEICKDTFYTNEDGDYINAINYRYDGSHNGRTGHLIISYNNYFNIADDFEAFFVLSNGENNYRTEVETTHWLYGDSIRFSYDKLDPTFDLNNRNYTIIESFHVVEVWIRTVL